MCHGAKGLSHDVLEDLPSLPAPPLQPPHQHERVKAEERYGRRDVVKGRVIKE
jgi:hypothetical protein